MKRLAGAHVNHPGDHANMCNLHVNIIYYAIIPGSIAI